MSIKFSFAVASVIFLMCAAASAQEVKKGTITGQVMIKGNGPMAGGMVFIFNDASGPPPSRDKYWRVPDNVVKIDAEGRFSADLPAGKYYLGAKKAMAGKDIGPPQEGDLFYAFSGEKEGMPKAFKVEEGKKTDVGVIAEATPFRRESVKFNDGITAIEGVIIDGENKPVEGALVFAYTVPSMMGRPLFASERTGKDGKYILRVHEGGSYYLRVRSLYGGGPPATGEMIGAYGITEPVAVTVKSGEKVKDITITVRRFSGRGLKAPVK
jgi:hypothetical protein